MMTIALASRKWKENKTTCPRRYIHQGRSFLVMGKVVDRFLIIRPSVNGVSLLFPHRHPFMRRTKRLLYPSSAATLGRPSLSPHLNRYSKRRASSPSGSFSQCLVFLQFWPWELTAVRMCTPDIPPGRGHRDHMSGSCRSSIALTPRWVPLVRFRPPFLGSHTRAALQRAAVRPWHQTKFLLDCSQLRFQAWCLAISRRQRRDTAKPRAWSNFLTRYSSLVYLRVLPGCLEKAPNILRFFFLDIQPLFCISNPFQKRFLSN